MGYIATPKRGIRVKSAFCKEITVIVSEWLIIILIIIIIIIIIIVIINIINIIIITIIIERSFN